MEIINFINILHPGRPFANKDKLPLGVGDFNLYVVETGLATYFNKSYVYVATRVERPAEIKRFLDGREDKNLGVKVAVAFMNSPEDFNHLCKLFSDVNAECNGNYFRGGSAKEFIEGIAVKYKRQAIERDMGI